MNPEIKPFNPENEYFFHEGCHIMELSNQDGDSDLSIARARVSPGVTTTWHRLEGTIERYVILEGQGLVELENINPRKVFPGDAVIIPANCPQRITNTGTTDLIFLALCTPRFKPENYRTLE